MMVILLWTDQQAVGISLFRLETLVALTGQSFKFIMLFFVTATPLT